MQSEADAEAEVEVEAEAEAENENEEVNQFAQADGIGLDKAKAALDATLTKLSHAGGGLYNSILKKTGTLEKNVVNGLSSMLDEARGLKLSTLSRWISL